MVIAAAVGLLRPRHRNDTPRLVEHLHASRIAVAVEPSLSSRFNDFRS